MKNKKQLMAILLLSSAFSIHAELVTFACPKPENIHFIPHIFDYEANAWVQIVHGDTPAFLMQGSSMSNQVNDLKEAVHQRINGKGYFKCIYSTQQKTEMLTLTNEPTFGLEYCHFIHVGSNTHECYGGINHCQLQCELLF